MDKIRKLQIQTMCPGLELEFYDQRQHYNRYIDGQPPLFLTKETRLGTSIGYLKFDCEIYCYGPIEYLLKALHDLKIEYKHLNSTTVICYKRTPYQGLWTRHEQN